MPKSAASHARPSVDMTLPGFKSLCAHPIMCISMILGRSELAMLAASSTLGDLMECYKTMQRGICE